MEIESVRAQALSLSQQFPTLHASHAAFSYAHIQAQPLLTQTQPCHGRSHMSLSSLPLYICTVLHKVQCSRQVYTRAALNWDVLLIKALGKTQSRIDDAVQASAANNTDSKYYSRSGIRP
ncbi:hypothetical protein Baya_14135 [Bagarius yarrelli]|uniref:Uncharacterized protein n=1 Tax=Bagarius yarrelli TaxID=175774 RepID=A0A556V7P7_BAGYA|nr:hypothetical protein Baya_14135 [Bagarius yarrelli]